MASRLDVLYEVAETPESLKIPGWILTRGGSPCDREGNVLTTEVTASNVFTVKDAAIAVKRHLNTEMTRS